MKLSMMQPYFFPYLGYFQLINSADEFIFYDNINFIKRGWVNRNRILIHNEAKYLTLPLEGASSFKKINEIQFINHGEFKKLKKKIQSAYKKAPLYDQVYPLIEECFKFDTSKISELSIYAVKRVCRYLGIDTSFETGSEKFSHTEEMEKTERIITICRQIKADTYINSIGGQDLYQKEIFQEAGIDLLFLKPGHSMYKQFENDFIPDLSIIDVMMFNPPERIKEMLNDYTLV
jgi:hypothetical protein